MVCFLGAWDEGKRQADTRAEFYWIDQLIFSIQTPLYPYALTSPMAALALFMWQTRDVSPPHLIHWLSLRGIPFSTGQAPTGPQSLALVQLTASLEVPRGLESRRHLQALCAVFIPEAEICPLLLPRGSVVCQQGGHVSE